MLRVEKMLKFQIRQSLKTPILDALKKYVKNQPVRLHIPGHSGRSVLKDFKTLMGENTIKLDNPDDYGGVGSLFPATDAVKDSIELTQEVFGAKNSFFLLNGSTIGNLALAMTVAQEGKKVLVSRNCHRSVINGLILSGGEPVWLLPRKREDWGVWAEVRLEDIKDKLKEEPDISVIWLTCPTYEGIVSDIASIAKFCKEKNIILIVDEAHGSLWSFHDELPTPSIHLGADAVVNSLHKTAGSFTQSSLLHLSHESKINAKELETNLKLLHTTSPSIILLASIDAARAYISSKEGLGLVHNAVENAKFVRRELKSMRGVECLESSNGTQIDPTKIYLKIKGLGGKRIKSILEIEHRIEIETATDDGILALSNPGNTREDMKLFLKAIKSITEKSYTDITYLEKSKFIPFTVPQTVMLPKDAYIAEKEELSPQIAVGRIAAELVSKCPPGIPIFVPGEIIREEHLEYLGDVKSILVVK